MAQKKAKRAHSTYTDEQKKELLAKWDGTMAGAKTLKVAYQSIKGWRDGELPVAKKSAKTEVSSKAKKPSKTTAFDDALGLLLSTVHVGKLKSLPKDKYGEELKRVRILQRVVAKAVNEGNAAPGVGRSLAKHFDALIEGL
jgi:hypothetical protein